MTNSEPSFGPPAAKFGGLVVSIGGIVMAAALHDQTGWLAVGIAFVVVGLLISALGLFGPPIAARGRAKTSSDDAAATEKPQESLDGIVRVEIVDPPEAEPYVTPTQWRIWLRVTNMTGERHAFQAKVVALTGVANPVPLCPWPIPWRSRVTVDCDLAPGDTEYLRLATADPTHVESALPPMPWTPGCVTFHELHIGLDQPIDRAAFLADLTSLESLYDHDMLVDIMIWEVGLPAPPPAVTRRLSIGFTREATMRMGFIY